MQLVLRAAQDTLGFSDKKISFLAICCFAAVLIAAHAEDRIWIDAKINDQPVRLIFDTGATDPILFRSTAERLKLKITDPPPGSLANPGKVLGGFTEPCDLTLRAKSQKEVFRVVDMPIGIQTQVEGALSWRPLRSKVFSFDAAHQRLDIGENVPEDALMWSKFTLRTNTEVLGFRVSDGEPGHDCIYIDTGSEAGIELNPALWKKWTLAQTNQPATISGQYSPATGFMVRKEVWAKELTFGALVFKEVPVREEIASLASKLMPDHAATLGLFALRRLDLIADGEHGVAYVRPKDAPGPVYQHNRLGATFIPRDMQSDLLKAHVLAGSPAYQAGIRDGDVLLKIGDIDYTKWRTVPHARPSTYWELPAGTALDLTLKRGEKEFSVKVILQDLLGPDVIPGGRPVPVP